MLVLITTGCATNEYVTGSFNIPPVPALPTVEAEQLECLSDSTYRDVIIRDRKLQDWGLEQRTILLELKQHIQE